MNKKSGTVKMAIIAGSTTALLLAIYAIQYYQGTFGTDLSTIPPEAAISIVAKAQNLINYNSSDYAARFVYIDITGDVFYAGRNSMDIGERIGMAEPTSTGSDHYAWEVKSVRSNSTYYVDSKAGNIVSKSR